MSSKTGHGSSMGMFSILLLTLAFGLAELQSAAADRVVRTGYCMDTFTSLEKRDVEVALNVLLGKILETADPGFSHEWVLIEDAHRIAFWIEQGDLDIVEMLTTDYMKLKKQFGLMPALVSLKNGRPTEQYLLLVRRAVLAEGLDRLHEGKLLVSATGNGTVARIWLDTVLLRDDRAGSGEFFSDVRTVDMPSQAVLPVFFGQADACLVSAGAFRTMTELNPQVGQQVLPLVQSGELLVHVACYVGQPDEEMRRIVEEFSPAMGETPEGRQLLTIFQIEGLGPYTPGLITDVERLYEEYRRLTVAGAEK